MSARLPAPLVPAFVQPFGARYVPLPRAVLAEHPAAAHPDAEVFRCVVALIAAAWFSTPPASLPADECALAAAAGLGRDLARWRGLAPVAMAGWLRCADGRLHLPVLATEVLRIELARLERARGAAATNAKLGRVSRDAADHEARIAELERCLEHAETLAAQGFLQGRSAYRSATRSASRPADATKQKKTNPKEPPPSTAFGGATPLAKTEAASPAVAPGRGGVP